MSSKLLNIGLGGGLGGSEKNRGTVLKSLQFAFTDRVVPAKQAFDWLLICADNGFSFTLIKLPTF